MQQLTALQPYMVCIPIPGLILSIAAIVLPRLRPVLAALAAIASVLAMILVVASLVAAMAPMYQISRDFEPR